MKINFTKKQFGLLVDLLYLGEWTANSTKNHDERNAEYDALFQYVSTFAKDFGYDHAIEYDNKLEGYYPTQQFEESFEPIIKHHDNEIFWSQLVGRLAKRDLEETGETFATPEDYLRRLFELEEKYEEEFEQNGIKNIRISDNHL
ncbi:hypothetical protein FZW96_07730 [Bacillus sp. BGMRC 2118]|nr:hypothetical protein FZW96_07730 [Bacillus sp. BGMRC 2118]